MSELITYKDYNKIRNTKLNEDGSINTPIFPILDPNAELPKGLSSLESLVAHLGNLISVKDHTYDLCIKFEGGEVNYSFETKYESWIPADMVIYGVTATEGVPSLYTEEFDTNLFFTIVKPNAELSEDLLYYQIPNGPLLMIERYEGEKNIRQDWWGRNNEGEKPFRRVW
jgi:hypothetical protein